MSIYTANATKKHKNQFTTCLPELPKEYKKLKKAINKIEKNTEDNYLYVLPVYNVNYPIDTTSKAWKTLSSIIQKAVEEIDYAEAKDSSYCPNIAEIYKLKGIALFYQKQYQLAYEMFDAIITEFPYNTSLLEVYTWLARTSTYFHAYEKTVFFLAEAENFIDTNQKENLVFFHNVAAEYYIEMKDYKNALEHLIQSVNLSSKSISTGFSLNTRLAFIMAQTAEQLNSYHLALLHYNTISRKIFINKLMKSYSIVHHHLCEKNIERQYLDSIAEQQWKELRPVPKDFEPTIVESSQDSSFFVRNYPYYFNDYAAMFFLNEFWGDYWDDYDDYDYEDYGEEDDGSEMSDDILELIFENWEFVSIHIPKTDFSNMKDTIYIPLIGNATYELPRFNTVVSRFGWRRYRYHYGTDLKGNTGDSIYCLFDGVVRIAVGNKTYGNVIIVRHYNGLETFYAHCSKLLVSPNQEVKAGELIGLIGNTGRSRGPHLHLETRYKGTAFNPEYMIDFRNKKLVSDTLVLTKETFNYKNIYSSPPNSSGTKYHQVKSGETLDIIAKKYKITTNDLKRMNGLKSDAIREGQRLRVP